ncbi:hypothetical protein [Thysanoplusia orichalcea nucleopolyhedrovirus]|uniref:Uncharacterized protein n=1 Tax=Thysanoplusia orichalcea nucleopolyhedrovirus TaxID=101850 RepID=L0CM28_9ABAC|nr:hypothetical protein [Thysanoplusia orichalcea nucleopolyhedrovirus]AGA16281.1 hypothetical protein [Thysanoplusia orichalcea nucleopolyhedrovirus]
MSDKTPKKSGGSGGHAMTLRERGVTKPVKKMEKSEKLEQYKKAISAQETLPTKADIVYIKSPSKNETFKRLEILEKEAAMLENKQKQLYPIFNMPLDNFIVVFVHPTYPMTYFVNSNFQLKLQCSRISKRLLYKDNKDVVINRLKLSSFKVQLNNTILDVIELIEYDTQNKILTITAPVQNYEIKKSIIYFNFLPNNDWQVPKHMKQLFNRMELEPPAAMRPSV